jgi:ribosomal protein S27AE
MESAGQDVDFVVDGVHYTAKQGYTELPVYSGQHTVEVPMFIYSGKGVREAFEGWREIDPTAHEVVRYLPNVRQVNVRKPQGSAYGERYDLWAAYVRQYYLNLTSPFGTVSGGGWYNASSTAHFSIDPVQFRSEGILGLLGAKTNFAHWQGDVTIMPASGEVVMNSPHVLQAVWQTDLSAIYISAGALGVFLLVLSIAGAYTYRRIHVTLDFGWLRNYMEKHGPVAIQDIHCPYCGGNVIIPDRGTYTHCTHCGRAVYVKQIFEWVKEIVDRA